ncbi:MAG: type II secretion system minor pseudopilin GspI [Steroidobacteraceae bacterium]|nr:type II secretion system minor pseudopilin GspI [Steroidobacteraceae bacterium]
MSARHSRRRISQAPFDFRRSGGFTLIEVLVALAIVTFGMAALLSTLSSSADSIAYLRDKTLAEWVALNRIEEVRLALRRPTKGESEGEAEMAGRRWRWRQEVNETEIKGMMRIDVSVRPVDAPGGKDSGWYATLSAMTGDALALPRGDMDPFATALPPGAGGPNGPNLPGDSRGREQPSNDDDAGDDDGASSPTRPPGRIPNLTR